MRWKTMDSAPTAMTGDDDMIIALYKDETGLEQVCRAVYDDIAGKWASFDTAQFITPIYWIAEPDIPIT